MATRISYETKKLTVEEAEAEYEKLKAILTNIFDILMTNANNKFCKNISLTQEEKDEKKKKFQEENEVPITTIINKLEDAKKNFSSMNAEKITHQIETYFYAQDLLKNIGKFINTKIISEDGHIDTTSRVFEENKKIFEEIERKKNQTAMELLEPYKNFLLDPKQCNPAGGKPRSKRSRKNKKSKNTRRKSIRRRRR